MDLGHSVQITFLCVLLQFEVIVSFRQIHCHAIAHQYMIIGSNKLPYHNILRKYHASGFKLSPANNESLKGNTGLYSKAMWYNEDYVAYRIEEISVL
jgi:hypothetical protein